jgi:hypothetical protein
VWRITANITEGWAGSIDQTSPAALMGPMIWVGRCRSGIQIAPPHRLSIVEAFATELLSQPVLSQLLFFYAGTGFDGATDRQHKPFQYLIPTFSGLEWHSCDGNDSSFDEQGR